jgi:hypothetical protein
MNVEELFKELDPPRGGTARFARRLEAAASAPPAPRRRGFALAAAAAAAAMSVAIVVLVLRQPSDTEQKPVAELQPVPNIYDAPAFDRLLGRPLQGAGLAATVGQQPRTLTELESQNTKVRIYRID